jgi:dolichol-phosphate mannosyltransferase
MRSILIIIPTYNEAKNIRPLLRAIDDVFRHHERYQPDILFVDDYSPDGTADVIRKLRDKRSGSMHLIEGKKAGLGQAYLRGFARGLTFKKGYDAFVMMDADLSHDPASIPELLAELESGADYAVGSRYVPGGHFARGYSPLRRLQSRVANFLARGLLGSQIAIKDLTSGYKAVRVSSLRDIPLQTITATGYVFQVSLVYEFVKRGYDVREVPITFRSRNIGKSKLGLRDSLEFLRLTYGLNPQANLPRFLRFALVGTIGTIVNLGVLVMMHNLVHLSVIVAYMIALEVSIISNFLFNQSFTFQIRINRTLDLVLRSRQLLSRLTRYNLVSLSGVAISWMVFMVATQGAQLHYVVADIVAIIAATGWNYWLSVQYVWQLTDQSEFQHETQEI